MSGELPAEVDAPAKLTVRLRVVGVRADGFHLLDAEFVSIDLRDRLRFSAGRGVTYSGPHHVDVAPSDDLVARALASVGRHQDTAVTVWKNIPAGAGLGGGSADAAAVMRWAGVTDPGAAARLGADVPFCLSGGRARVSGIGEELEPLPHVDRVFTLLTPPRHSATPAVYAAWDELGGPSGEGDNDLEPAALRVLPELARWRDRLGEATGRVPQLAGSGSTWFVEGSFPGPGLTVVRTIRGASQQD